MLLVSTTEMQDILVTQ